MANIRLLHDNLYTASATTLTASSAATALPIEASQDIDRSYVWRSLTETGTQEIEIDLGSVLAVTSVAVANVALVGTGVLELYERGDGSSPGSATLVATLPTQNDDRRTAAAFFASQSHRHWQLKWTNPTAASDYAELGYAHLGTYLEPTINVSVPLPLEEIDPSAVRLSIDRQRRAATRTRYTVGRFVWAYLPDADRDNLRALWETAGVARPLFAVLDTSLAWTSWLIYLTGSLEQMLEEVSGRYGVGLPWEEAT